MLTPSCRRVCLALLLALSGRATAALAHGGNTRAVVEAAPLGPYTLSVWVAPATPRPGELHIIAAVADAAAPVVDCRVAVTAIRLDGEELPLTAQAGPATPATGYRHEAALTLPHDGHYRFTVTVRDPAGVGGMQQFELLVRPASVWMNALIYVQLLLAPVIGLWLLREGVTVWRRITWHAFGKNEVNL